MVNPMNMNWDEMIEFVRFTEKHECNLWYNTILYPSHVTIKHMPTKEIQLIIQYLNDELKTVTGYRNYTVAEHLIIQIENWCLDSVDGTPIKFYDEFGGNINEAR